MGLFGMDSTSSASQSQQTAGDGAKQVRGNNSNVTESGGLTIGTKGTLVAPGSVSLSGSSKLNTGQEASGSAKILSGPDFSGSKGNITLTTNNTTPPGLFDFLTGQTNSLTNAIKAITTQPAAAEAPAPVPVIFGSGGGSDSGVGSLSDALGGQPAAAATVSTSGSKLLLWIGLAVLAVVVGLIFWKRKK